jgi:hypothetical protein
VLKRHGVRGKHTNAAAYRAIQEAMSLIQEIQTKELALKHDPTVERVKDIMDLYRQAAERFEVAGDVRHEEVVSHLRKFLALPLTTSILDGSYQRPAPAPGNDLSSSVGGGSGGSYPGEIREGEVLERPAALLLDEDDPDHQEATKKATERESDKAFEENMENILKEAQEDFEKFSSLEGIGDTKGGGGERDQSGSNLSMGDVDLDDAALANVAADLDALMKQADQEFAELMKA